MPKRDDEIHCDYTDEIVCPHCGHEQSDSYEYFEGGGETTRLQCGECELEFEVERTISVSYSSSKIDHEAEARKKAEDEQERAALIERCRQYPPGTRVRVTGGPRAGKEGVVANREVGPYVWVVDEAGQHVAAAGPEHVKAIQ